MAKLVKLFIIFGPVQGSIKVIKKYANPGETIDESLMSTLCLPRIELVEEPEEPKFQTFLVTKEDGQVLYGSGLLVHDRHHEPPPHPGAGRYASYCYTIITDTPFINATRSLLHLIWEKRCDDIIIRSVMNIPLPAKRRCLRIVPPIISNSKLQQSTSKRQQRQLGFGSSVSTDHTLVNQDANTQAQNLINSSFSGSGSNINPSFIRTIDDIYLYRGMADLPLLDYPLRELFNVIQIDDFLLAFACILMEFRTLIISQDNYKLMMVGETLTSLLLPLKWCNVYVPILPPVYGATYLDAPTSYIMGINTQVTELPENLNHIQCRIYCDDSRVICDADSLALPLFLNDLKKDILKIIGEYQTRHAQKPFTYLDDLKFNRAIRILFIKTIRKHILANYERYIVDVPESSQDIRQFDVVSYLSDQPEFMHSFLSKFLDTQLFASFVDENAKRIQQSWLSIFDMDPEELSEHFTDKALEQAFHQAHRMHLMDLRDEQPDIEVKTVPASPMKLRRKIPGLASIASRLSFANKSSHMSAIASVDHGTDVGVNQTPITSSPPIHRNSVATVSLQGHLSLNPTIVQAHKLSPIASNNHTNSGSCHHPAGPMQDSNSPMSLRTTIPVSQPVPNGKIVELINEVKDLTKRILIDKMDTPSDQLAAMHSMKSHSRDFGSLKGGNNTLIGALCDLIERVWSHGAFVAHHDNTACCPLWNHLIAFTRLKYLDSKPSGKFEFPDGSHLNVLSSKGETTDLDLMVVQNTNIFSQSINWFKSKRFQQIGPMARDLINDLSQIHTLNDVKTDVGKARAFIRLSLEKKKLSKHLKTLLGDQTLLNTLYKPYAFLRCEEEREQFLMYLLTLNAVDLPCFTTTFVSVINTRRTRAAA